jgi:hypothetical protein
MDPGGMPQPSGQVPYPPASSHYQAQLPQAAQGFNTGVQGLGSFQPPQYGLGGQVNVQQQIQAIGESIRTSQHSVTPTPFGAHPLNSMAGSQSSGPDGGLNAGLPFSSPLPIPNQQPLPNQPQLAPPQTAEASYQLYYGPQLNPATAQFFSLYEPPPPVTPGPTDLEEVKRIDKVAEYAAKNGQQFEALMKEKQKDNPAYAFLVGGENSAYYRYKLWSLLNPHIPPEQMHLVYVHPAPQQAAFAYPGSAPQDSFSGEPAAARSEP